MNQQWLFAILQKNRHPESSAHAVNLRQQLPHHKDESDKPD